MRTLKLALCLAACAMFIAACTTAPGSNQMAGGNTANTRPADAPAATPTAAARPAPTADELAAIRGIYAQECQRCHKADGAGGTFEEEGLKPLKVPGLREGAARHTDEQLARKISNGDIDDGMPAFKAKLTPQQINELVRLIRVDFQGRAPGAPGASNTNAPASAH